MAGPACKVIINEVSHAIGRALEKILAMSSVREKIGDELADKLLQRLADADIAVYNGTPGPSGGHAGILAHLEKLEVLTDEMWLILRRPGE